MKAIRIVTVPDIGDFKDVPIIEILVKPGDLVTKDAPLFVLESDKATLDVPSPENGIVKEIKVALGTRVCKGSLLLTLDEASDGTGAASQDPATASAAVTGNANDDPANAAAQNFETVAAFAPAVPRTTQWGAVSETIGSQVVNSRSLAVHRTVHGSPSIRRMAREFGVDLGSVVGTGPRGRIVRQDLQQFVKRSFEVPATPTGGDNLGGLKIASWPKIDFATFGRIERTPLSKIRRISGTNLARNAIVIPHVTNFEDADITELDTFRRTLNAEMRAGDAKVTILSFLIKALTVTIGKYEQFNSSLDGDELILKRYFHIGFAADTPNGLVVPVIRDVNMKGITQIASEAAALAAQARDGKLRPLDIQGGCITVSSLGGVGGTGFTPIINAPEVAILGVTRAQMRPVWDGKRFRPRLILPLMLSWDHRVVDGVAAANFLVHLSKLLADFRRVII